MIAAHLLAPASGLAGQLAGQGTSAAPGSTVVIPLLLDSQGSLITGLQMDLEWDEMVMDVTVVAGSGLRDSRKNLFQAARSANSTRLLIAGTAPDPVSDGNLLNLFISLKRDVPNGSYPLKVSNALASSEEGEAVPLDGAPLTVDVQDSLPVQLLPAEGVLSAASLLPGEITPGQMLLLMGPGLWLGDPPDLVVTFDGETAPLLVSGARFLRIVAPRSLPPVGLVNLRVVLRGKALADLWLPVRPAQPGIFTKDSTGIGQGLIQNEDGSLNSEDTPAFAGTVVTVYATGVSQGAAGNSVQFPPTALVAGRPAEIVVVGASAGDSNGTVGIRVRLPAELLSHNSAPIVLIFDNVPTQQGVTIALRGNSP